MAKEDEEQEKIDKTRDANTEKQEAAMAETFGYDEGGSEKDEGGESEEEETSGEEEQEQPSGGEEEEGGEEQESSEEEGEEVSDELDDILGKHEGADVSSEDEDSEEEEEDEPSGEEEDEEDTSDDDEVEEYEPMNLDLDNDQFEEVTSSPEAFSDFIKDVREDAVKEAEHNMQEQFQEALDKRSAEIEENILQNIPEVIDKSHNRAQKVANTKEQFFKDYPDLENKQGYVRNMTALVSDEHPDWNAEQVLNEVGKRAERDLEITKQAEEREQQRSNDDDNPKFAGAGGRQSPGGGADNRDKQQKLMDETFGKS